MKNRYDVIIVGCGTAAGFFLSFLKDSGKKAGILILERSPKIFRKLRASGNGRCNYSNLEMGEEQYYSFSASREWKQKAFLAAKKCNLQGYFYRSGIPSETDEYRRLFPYTNSAATIAEYFENALKSSGAELLLNAETTAVKKDLSSGGYRVDWAVDGKARASAGAGAVVFCAGGSAYPQYGTDGTALKLLKPLGHRIIEQVPGIVPLESPDKMFRELAGMKLQTEIEYGDFKRTGELLFADYGISGPNTLYASNAVSMDLAKGPVAVNINFLPKNELTLEYFEYIRRNSASKSFADIFRGALQAKFLNAFQRHHKGLEGQLSDKGLADAFARLTRYPVKITKTRGFKEAQVSLGGVECGGVDPETFESISNKNLYILGEALDYTGACGGYNIHWAAATAFAAAQNFNSR